MRQATFVARFQFIYENVWNLIAVSRNYINNGPGSIQNAYHSPAIELNEI